MEKSPGNQGPRARELAHLLMLGTRIQSLSSDRGSDNLAPGAHNVSMRNIRLVLAYDGTDFHGWQRQPNASTIQELLEDAIHRLTGNPATLLGSGRTDAGVHASHQVANFHTRSTIPCLHLSKALNNLLPPSVRVVSADVVASSFHARYAVKQKTYWYRISMSPVCSPLLCRFVHHYPYPINRKRMVARGGTACGRARLHIVRGRT